MNSNGDKELTREELYEKIWSVPITQLAAELGISDVALAKRCKKLNVPKPPLRYWAKVAAGMKQKKVPLPPTPNEVFIKTAEKSPGKTLPIPQTTEQLHSLATELLRRLTTEKPSWDKRIRISECTLPEVAITKALIERAAKSFHTILNGVEHLGITFRKAQGSYGPGFFQRGRDRLYLEIKEDLVDRFGSRRPSLQWQTDGVPSGVLTFSINPERYGIQKEKQWKEDGKSSLGKLLAQIVTAIRRHYIETQKRQAEEAIERKKQRVEYERRWREHQEKEAIRLEEERKQKHEGALEATAHVRSEDLLKAAEWWRLYQTAVEFIHECEQRWRNSQANELTTEQEAWLLWARENAKAMSPFELGYPDPTKDGPFDPSSVPFGGPYPCKRDFPRPPTMPKIPPPVQQNDHWSSSTPEPKQQYPFWLKHHGR